MHLPTLIDQHLPTPGHGHGLSLGWVSPIWLSAMCSRGAHRLVQVASWGAPRLWTLRTATGQAGARRDGTDARLESGLRRVRDETRGAPCDRTRHQPTVRGDDPPPARRHVESTSART
jgi:hypothetical protein